MSGQPLSRRTILTGTALTLASLAGCSSQQPASSDNSPTATSSPEGTATSSPDATDTETATGTDTTPTNASNYRTITAGGTAVPLAPIDDVIEWYRNDAAKFADARSLTAYEEAHIKGAVFSPAPQGQSSGDPVAEWSKSTRIVTYCGCPHHLSSLRAGALIDAGYENVYALDEGFWEWHSRGYPMAGSEVSQQPQSMELRGMVDPAYAGETVWATHPDSGQREAGPVAADGSYALELHFYDVTPDSLIRVETPSYVVEGALGDLTAGVIRG